MSTLSGRLLAALWMGTVIAWPAAAQTPGGSPAQPAPPPSGGAAPPTGSPVGADRKPGPEKDQTPPSSPGIAGGGPEAAPGNAGMAHATEPIPVGPTVAEANVDVPPLTLDQAVAIAEANNPQITIGQSQLGQSQAVARQRSADRLPLLTLHGSLIGVTPAIPTAGDKPGQIGSTSLTTGANAAVTQSIYDSGLRTARLRSARNLVRAQTQFLMQTREDVALAVAVAFYDVLRNRQLIQVAQQRLTAAQAHLRIAEALVGEGVAPSFDVVRSRAEVANAQGALEVAVGDERITESVFNEVLARDVRLPVRLIEPPALPDVPVTLDQSLEAAYEFRPQLKALQSVIRAAEQDIRAARASGGPALDLAATYGRNSPPNLGSVYGGNAGILFSYPLFDAGRVKYLTQQFIQLAEQRRAEAIVARNQIEAEIRADVERVVEARARFAAAQVELQQATRSLEIANVRYRAGRATNVELTDAQVELATAGEDLANARYDYLVRTSTLEHGTGATIGAILAQPPAAVRPGGEVPPAETAGANPLVRPQGGESEEGKGK